jgi:hypothetical protein
VSERCPQCNRSLDGSDGTMCFFPSDYACLRYCIAAVTAELKSALEFLRSYKADDYKGYPPETLEHYVSLAKALGWTPTDRSENG